MLKSGKPPATLTRAGIAQRIPHQANMCLLDEVAHWDAQHITCQASSHHAPDNPLRAHGRLGAACGIEYAAQAMAVHGALMGEALAGGGDARPRAGYLASVRSVSLLVRQLDTEAGPLTVSAERLTGDDNTALYSFELQAGAKVLLRGRAVVVLDAAALTSLPVTREN